MSHLFFFFFNDTATTEISTLSLHDALPISLRPPGRGLTCAAAPRVAGLLVRVGAGDPAARRAPRRDRARPARLRRSEEHTSELQSPCNLVCRLLLEKKNKSSDVSRSTALVC